MYFIDLEVLAALVKKLKTLCNLGETMNIDNSMNIFYFDTLKHIFLAE